MLPIIVFRKTVIITTELATDSCFVLFCFVWGLTMQHAGISVPKPDIELGPTAMQVQRPNLWATRGVPWTVVKEFVFI